MPARFAGRDLMESVRVLRRNGIQDLERARASALADRESTVDVKYHGRIYRPPSEADSFILQATLGCSWNHCTYCDMYRDKTFRARPVDDVLADVHEVGAALGPRVEKMFVADGDALGMGLEAWLTILEACRSAFPRLRRVSCYATARNVLAKTDDELAALRDGGLDLLYIGPESGDDVTLKRIAKGATFDEHVEAARKAKAVGLRLSCIFLLGAGGLERSQEHATRSADLATAMDPQFLSTLTLTVVPGTPIARLQDEGRFILPQPPQLLEELRAFVLGTDPSNAVFRCNHASNYLPIGGRLRRDRDRIIETIDRALAGAVALRPEWSRGL